MDELRAQIGGGHAVRVPLEGGGGDSDHDHGDHGDHDHDDHDHDHDHEGHDHGQDATGPVGPPGRPIRRRAPRSGGTPA
jgi:hypothetical protein